MAIYHLSVKFVSRNQGRSPVSAAAYRAGEKLHNNYDGQTHDYTSKRGIVHNEILLPENAPQEFADRETLWNAAEFAEKRRDARTAREIEIALPGELNLDEQINLVREYAQDNFISRGMCADIAIHDGKHLHKKDERHEEAEHDNIITPDNPHAHILVTARPLSNEGFLTKKNREWEKRENVRQWRENWADIQNKEFERRGLDVRVSHESNAARGIDQEPTIHLGQIAHAMEQRGIHTEIGDHNRAVKSRNLQRKELERQIKTLQQEINRLEQERKRIQEQIQIQEREDITSTSRTSNTSGISSASEASKASSSSDVSSGAENANEAYSHQEKLLQQWLADLEQQQEQWLEHDRERDREPGRSR